MGEIKSIGQRVAEIEECLALLPEGLDCIMAACMALNERVNILVDRVTDLESAHNEHVGANDHDFG